MSTRAMAGLAATVTLLLLLIGFDAFVLPGGGHLVATVLWVLASGEGLWRTFRPNASMLDRSLRGHMLMFSGIACLWGCGTFPRLRSACTF